MFKKTILFLFILPVFSIPIYAECTEDEEGIDYTKRGWAEGPLTQGGSIAHYEDTCLNNITLNEYYCQSGLIKSTTYQCPTPYGCQNGKCESPPSGCWDSDNSIRSNNDQFIPGYSYGIFWQGLGVLVNGTGHIIGKEDHSGYDYKYNSSLKYSIFYDYCDTNNQNRLWEAKCSILNNQIPFMWVVYTDCQLGCQNGACIKPSVECIDYDKNSPSKYFNVSFTTGLDPLGRIGFVKPQNGSLWYYDIENYPDYSIGFDHCSPYLEYPDAIKQLNEAKCDSEGKITFEGYNCGYKCENSSCAPFSCEDSDSGKVIDVKGAISGQTSLTNYQNPQTFTDFCSESNLTEYYCANGLINKENIACEHGCNLGRCNAAPICTDIDSDGYSSEEADCGARDCDDNNARINPGANELCNDIDDDCDSLIDETKNTDADINCNGCVSNLEFSLYLEKWVNLEVSNQQFTRVVIRWIILDGC